jgi:AraC family transcriptional regulator
MFHLSPAAAPSTSGMQTGSFVPAAVGDALRKRSRCATIVAKLLEDAARVMGNDREAALVYIDRAAALLRDDRGHRASGVDRMPAELARGGLAAWQIRRVKAHIATSLSSTIRLNDLAEMSRLSRSHFSRAFKKSFGETLVSYIARRRIEQAQDIMTATNEPLSQIALECGLTDQANFSRLFRRIVGTSPNLWRRQWVGEEISHPRFGSADGCSMENARVARSGFRAAPRSSLAQPPKRRSPSSGR